MACSPSRMPMRSATLASAVMVGLLVTAPPLDAAIIGGSTAQFTGTARFAAGGTIDFISFGAAPVGTDAAVVMPIAGNSGSFAGYNIPNPAALPAFPFYVSGVNDIVGGAPPAGNFIVLPALTLGGGEPGPAVGGASFIANSWATNVVSLSGINFFQGVVRGNLVDANDGSSIAATFSLSSQNFQPGAESSFSATLRASTETTVIPVPTAGWMLGSGLLLLMAMLRRSE